MALPLLHAALARWKAGGMSLREWLRQVQEGKSGPLEYPTGDECVIHFFDVEIGGFVLRRDQAVRQMDDKDRMRDPIAVCGGVELYSTFLSVIARCPEKALPALAAQIEYFVTSRFPEKKGDLDDLRDDLA